MRGFTTFLETWHGFLILHFYMVRIVSHRHGGSFNFKSDAILESSPLLHEFLDVPDHFRQLHP